MTKSKYGAHSPVLSVILACIGCAGNARVEIPKIDAATAAKDALDEYDRNGDNVLSREELRSCPSILTRFSKFDKDGDEHLSAAEIAQRIRAWEDTRVGIVAGYTCNVRYNGQPLAGAEVRLLPETFLSSALKRASGISNQSGVASLAIADDDLPISLQGLQGVQFGLYSVKITHPSKKIADKFNTNTVLGCEIFPSGDPVTFTFNVGPR